MCACYLVDEPLADVAARVAARDPNPVVVLVQDGVLLAHGDDATDGDGPLPGVDADVYAVADDAEIRGVDLPAAVEAIGYDALVELLFAHEVKSFV